MTHWKAFALLVLVAACSHEQSKAPAGAAAGTLTGAGATFPYPIYSKWFAEYAARTGTKINYQSIGSGGGIRQLSEETVDFGASDAPMNDTELAKAKGGAILHFPTVMGAVAITYNLPGISTPLQLTGQTLADIFMGKVRKWNAVAIAATNPGVALPATDILVVHRTDGSGTTYVFTSYLSAVSPDWKAGPGTGKEVAWPVGLGAKGNEGVAGQVKQTPGAIAYVELAYARENHLPVAAVRNAAGQFISPTIETITAAAAQIADTLSASSDYRLSMVDAPGRNAYPISSMTWLLVYTNQRNAAKGRTLVEFLRWMYDTGYTEAAALDYAPLPAAMRQRLVQRLSAIRLGAAQP